MPSCTAPLSLGFFVLESAQTVPRLTMVLCCSDPALMCDNSPSPQLTSQDDVRHGSQEIRTLLLTLVQLRPTPRRHGCQPIQGLRPRPAIHQVRERQVCRRAVCADQHPARLQLQGHGRAQGQAPTSATRSTRKLSRRWPAPTSCRTCRTSTTPRSSAAARKSRFLP